MTPTRLRECLVALHWSQGDLADVLGCSSRLVRRWAAGGEPVPDRVAEHLERLVALLEANPVPPWRRPRFGRS